MWADFFQYGVPTGLLVALCIALYRLANRLLNTAEEKLFDDEHGAIPRWVKNNGNFLDGISKRHEKQLRMCELHGETIVQLQENFAQPERFSTLDTNASLHDIIEAILIFMHNRDKLENGEKIKIEEILTKAKLRLEKD